MRGGVDRPVDQLPGVTPTWSITVPMAAEATALAVDHVTGPVIGGDQVAIGSSVIGFAGLAATTGRLVWQNEYQRAPMHPFRVGPSWWLPGGCAHASPPLVRPAVLGCVEIMDGGQVGSTRLVWLAAPRKPEGRALPPDSRDRVLELWQSPRGPELLWSYGPYIVSIGPREARPSAVYSLPEQIGSSGLCGWHIDGRGLLAAGCDGLVGFGHPGQGAGENSGGSDTATPIEARWQLPADRAIGVAGPIRAGERAFWIHDEHLEAVTDGRREWRGEDSYAYAPGSLSADGTDRVLALHASDGFRPVVVAAATGKVLSSGERAPGIQVLRARFAAGRLVVVVRLDSSLERDAVVAYDKAFRIAWLWPIPAPDRPRGEPIGLAVDRDAAFVFYDGSHLARLPLSESR